MKVILELSDKTLKALSKNAKMFGRSRKKHMEIVLIKDAEKPYVTPIELLPTKQHPKLKKITRIHAL